MTDSTIKQLVREAKKEMKIDLNSETRVQKGRSLSLKSFRGDEFEDLGSFFENAVSQITSDIQRAVKENFGFQNNRLDLGQFSIDLRQVLRSISSQELQVSEVNFDRNLVIDFENAQIVLGFVMIFEDRFGRENQHRGRISALASESGITLSLEADP